MTSTVRALVVLGVVAAAAPAPAACRWFGTQIDCDFAESHIVLGTQTAEPRFAQSVRPQPFSGGGDLGNGRTTSTRPFQLRLQNVGSDPSLCRQIGNETYCY